MEAFELTEGYGSTAQAPAARKWRGAVALKLAVMTLAVVAVLAISGGFSTRDQVRSVPGPFSTWRKLLASEQQSREAWPRVVLLASRFCLRVDTGSGAMQSRCCAHVMGVRRLGARCLRGGAQSATDADGSTLVRFTNFLLGSSRLRNPPRCAL